MQILNSPVPTITNPLCLCSSWTPADLSLSGLYLCGHSAGAHLAAMVLSTDWSQYSITPQIKGKAHRVIEMSELGLIMTHVETQMLHSWYPFFFFTFSLIVFYELSLSVAYMTSCPSCPPTSTSLWRWQSTFLTTVLQYLWFCCVNFWYLL